MRRFLKRFFVVSLIALASIAKAHEVDTSGRQSMLNIETFDLPQGEVKIAAGERTHPPSARTPWHTSGPKLIYLMEGTLTAYGLGGKTLVTWGPASGQPIQNGEPPLTGSTANSHDLPLAR